MASTPGERTYNAFVDQLGTGVTLDESPRIPWSELETSIKAAWEAAAGAAGKTGVVTVQLDGHELIQTALDNLLKDGNLVHEIIKRSPQVLEELGYQRRVEDLGSPGNLNIDKKVES